MVSRRKFTKGLTGAIGLSSAAMAGCTSDGGSESTPTSTEASDASDTESATQTATPVESIPGEIIAAAREEGSMTHYGATPSSDQEVWLEGFYENFPFAEVNYAQMGDAEVWSRVSSEKTSGNLEASFAGTSGLSAILSTAAQTDVIKPISETPLPDILEAEGYPESAYGEYYLPGYSIPLVLYYNTERMSEDDLPSNYLELTEDRFADELTMESPNLLGGTGAFFATLHEIWGESQFEEWANGLVENNVQLTTSGGDAFRPIANGEKLMGWGLIDDYTSAQGQENPPPVDIAWSAMNPVATQIHFAQAFIAGAPAQDMANLWAAYTVSEMGQESILDFGVYPMHPELAEDALPEGMPEGFEFKTAAYNNPDFYENADEWASYYEDFGYDL